MLVYSLVCLNVSLELSACVSIGEGNGGAETKERQRLILDFVDTVTTFIACKDRAWRVGYEYYCPHSPRPFCSSLALHALDVSTTQEWLVYTRRNVCGRFADVAGRRNVFLSATIWLRIHMPRDARG